MDEVREAEDPVENICETEMEEEEEGGAVESTELFLILVLVPDVGQGNQDEGVSHHTDDQHDRQDNSQNYLHFLRHLVCVFLHQGGFYSRIHYSGNVTRHYNKE